MNVSELIRALITWTQQTVCSGAANAAQAAECMTSF